MSTTISMIEHKPEDVIKGMSSLHNLGIISIINSAFITYVVVHKFDLKIEIEVL